MDDLAVDIDLPIAADLLKCEVAFSDNVRRCGVNTDCQRATLHNFDAANLVVRMHCQCSLHRAEVRLGHLRWPRNARPSLFRVLRRLHGAGPTALPRDVPRRAPALDNVVATRGWP